MDFHHSDDQPLGPDYPSTVDRTDRRVLIVEDDRLMSGLLATVLERHGFVVEVASDVPSALIGVEAFDPDLALLDISLGDGPSGLDLAHVLSRQRPDVALLFLTKHSDPRTMWLADSVPDRSGFLCKEKVRDTEYLLTSMEAVLADHPERVRHDRDATNPLASLSARQFEVLRLMSMGYTNESIAHLTQASLPSVERWIMQVFRALGIETRGKLNPRVEAVRRFVAATHLPSRP